MIPYAQQRRYVVGGCVCVCVCVYAWVDGVENEDDTYESLLKRSLNLKQSCVYVRYCTCWEERKMYVDLEDQTQLQ